MLIIPASADELLQAGRATATTTPTTTTATVNLDLRSRERNLSASLAGHFASANLRVGQHTRTVTPADRVTAAELVALQSIIAGADQSLRIGRGGRAVGGTFELTPFMSQAINNLVIPRRVTAISDFGSGFSVDLAGDFTNSGRFFAVSSSTVVSTANFSATNIYNNQGALLTSVLPARGISNITSAVANLNMSFNALNDIVNAGTISSSGRLAMTAGTSIINALPSGAVGPNPMLQAASNIQLVSANIANSGMIAATSGNATFGTTAAARDLLLNNIGGQILAKAGVIDFRDSSYASKDLTSVLGGLLDAQSINFFGGDGRVLAQVGRMSGKVNVTAGTANIVASSGQLDIGTMNLSGDPVIANMAGDVTLSHDLTFHGEDLAILASGSVIGTGIHFIDLSAGPAAPGRAGNLSIVAGFDFTNPEPSTFVLTRPSAIGGDVLLPGVMVVARNATASASAGNIMIVAHADSTGSTHGQIALGPIDASAVHGRGGDVAVFGQRGVQVDGAGTANAVDTSGAQAGSIRIYGTEPIIAGPIVLDNTSTDQRNIFDSTAMSGGVVGIRWVTTPVRIGPEIQNGAEFLPSPGSSVHSISFFNGTSSGQSLPSGAPAFTPGPLTDGAAADVVVQGNVNSSGSVSNGGAVILQSSSRVSVGGNIETSGGSAGGNGGYVGLGTSNGIITVHGGIDTSGGSPASSGQAGNAGAVIIENEFSEFFSPIWVSIDGNLILRGGNNTGTGDAGAGGLLHIYTSQFSAPYYRGMVIIGNANSGPGTGFIDTGGGNADVGMGGRAGNVAIGALTLQVFGANQLPPSPTSGPNGPTGPSVPIPPLGVSINASGGVCACGDPTKKGFDGAIGIATGGIQPIPANFDLISTARSEIALPGGMFEVGNPALNGTRGTIVSGSIVANGSNAASVIDAATPLCSSCVGGFFSSRLPSPNPPLVITPVGSGIEGSQVTALSPFVATPLDLFCPGSSGISLNVRVSSALLQETDAAGGSLVVPVYAFQARGISGTGSPPGSTSPPPGSTSPPPGSTSPPPGPTGLVHSLVTPGEALQISHGGLNLNTDGQGISGVLQIFNFELITKGPNTGRPNQPFTAFNIASLGFMPAPAPIPIPGQEQPVPPNLVTVSITGPNTVLVLPAHQQSSISGSLNFAPFQFSPPQQGPPLPILASTAQTINVQDGQLLVGPTGAITNNATVSLVVAGTASPAVPSVIINGEVKANSITFNYQGTTNIVMGSAGLLDGNVHFKGNDSSFSVAGGTINGQISTDPLFVPKSVTINSSFGAAASLGALTVNGGPLAIIVTNAASLTSLPGTTVSTHGGALSLITTNGGVSIGSINTSADSAIYGGDAGSVLIQAHGSHSAVSVKGDVLAVGADHESPLTAGRGGTVTITAPFAVFVAGNLLTSGGSNSGTGNGGQGGDITLSIDTTDNLSYTQIKIGGVISSMGGSALGPGRGGNGGNFTASAGTLQIQGASNGISLNTSSGSGNAAGTAIDGLIAIHTVATAQPMPTNWNLPSLVLSEAALPGGLFVVGDATVNGTVGAIQSGSTLLSSQFVNNQSFTAGPLSISTTGASVTLIDPRIRGGLVTSGDSNTRARTMLTPGEALALYQVTHGLPQTIGLNPQTIGLDSHGAVSDINPQTRKSPSAITLSQSEIPQFTAFVFDTGSHSGRVTLNIVGETPTLIMPANSAASIGGKIDFSTPGSVVHFNMGNQTQPLFLSRTGSVLASPTSEVHFVGTPSDSSTPQQNALTWSIAGNIVCGNVVLDANNVPLSLNILKTGRLENVIIDNPLDPVTINVERGGLVTGTVILRNTWVSPLPGSTQITIAPNQSTSVLMGAVKFDPRLTPGTPFGELTLSGGTLNGLLSVSISGNTSSHPFPLGPTLSQTIRIESTFGPSAAVSHIDAGANIAITATSGNIVIGDGSYFVGRIGDTTFNNINHVVLTADGGDVIFEGNNSISVPSLIVLARGDIEIGPESHLQGLVLTPYNRLADTGFFFSAGHSIIDEGDNSYKAGAVQFGAIRGISLGDKTQIVAVNGIALVNLGRGTIVTGKLVTFGTAGGSIGFFNVAASGPDFHSAGGPVVIGPNNYLTAGQYQIPGLGTAPGSGTPGSVTVLANSVQFLASGPLSPPPPPPPPSGTPPGPPVSSGSLAVLPPGMTSITASGDIQVVSTSGNLALGDGVHATANGGNISFLSAGKLLGGNNLSFDASVKDYNPEGMFGASFPVPRLFPVIPEPLHSYGGILFCSGCITSTQLIDYFENRVEGSLLARFSAVDPHLLGPAVTINDAFTPPAKFSVPVIEFGRTLTYPLQISTTVTDLGLVQLNGSGRIDIGHSTINVTGGAVIFDSMNPTSLIKLSGATFSSTNPFLGNAAISPNQSALLETLIPAVLDLGPGATLFQGVLLGTFGLLNRTVSTLVFGGSGGGAALPSDNLRGLLSPLISGSIFGVPLSELDTNLLILPPPSSSISSLLASGLLGTSTAIGSLLSGINNVLGGSLFPSTVISTDQNPFANRFDLSSVLQQTESDKSRSDKSATGNTTRTGANNTVAVSANGMGLNGHKISIEGANSQPVQLSLLSVASQVSTGASSSVLGLPGAILSEKQEPAGNRVVVLHAGGAVVDAGANSASVETVFSGNASATVTAAPDSAALVYNEAGKRIEITALGGKTDSAVVVHSSKIPGGNESLQPGDRMVISEALADEDIIPADGTESVVTGGIRIRKTHVTSAPQQFMSSSLMVHGSNIGLNSFTGLKGHKRLARHVAQSASQNSGGQPRPPRPGTDIAQNQDRAAAESTDTSKPSSVPPQFDTLSTTPATTQKDGGIPGLVSHPTDGSKQPLLVLAAGGTDFLQLGPTHLRLDKGAMLLRPHTNIKITTPLGDVRGSRDSVFCVEYDGRLRVKACSGPNNIWIMTGERKIPVRLGQEVMLTTQPAGQLFGDGIGRREIRVHTLSKSSKMLVVDCEFSIPAWLTASHFAGLHQSRNQETQALFKQLIKTAAAIHYATAGKGMYSAPSPDSNRPREGAAVPQRPSSENSDPILKASAL